MTSPSGSSAGEMRYGFGRNWEEFVERHWSEERIEASRAHILRTLKLADLAGKSFLDIGSGSGLHSLAAFRCGASRIVSFDYDADSVRTTRALRERAGSPAHWSVEQGSVLDAEYMRRLERADIVYSWGVLHHTGQMWKAVENATLPLATGGLFYIALYTRDVFIRPTAEYWLEVKRRYNRAGALGKKVMEWDYALRNTILPNLVRGRNPLPILRGGGQTRGMTYWTDVKDWLGGWPMEFAGIAETKAFCATLGLELLNVNAGEANTEYLFRRRGESNHWDAVLAGRRLEILRPPFEVRAGHARACRLEAHRENADSALAPRRSRVMLYEDGIPVGFAHQPHRHIEAHGGGRYSHWEDSLIFSATDGSDPNSNGREYSICAAML